MNGEANDNAQCNLLTKKIKLTCTLAVGVLFGLIFGEGARDDTVWITGIGSLVDDGTPDVTTGRADTVAAVITFNFRQWSKLDKY